MILSPCRPVDGDLAFVNDAMPTAVSGYVVAVMSEDTVTVLRRMAAFLAPPRQPVEEFPLDGREDFPILLMPVVSTAGAELTSGVVAAIVEGIAVLLQAGLQPLLPWPCMPQPIHIKPGVLLPNPPPHIYLHNNTR